MNPIKPKDPVLEPMADFFAARVEGYDAHMLANVEGCREAYPLVAELVPAEARHILDLGCGTGLELDYLLPQRPALQVTGIDLSDTMLTALRAKHPDKSLHLICSDYFAVELGAQAFDCALSVESLHHFSHARKLDLYRKLHAALVPGGCYIECDYMVDTQAEEDFFLRENARLRQEQGLDADGFFHYDTPFTVDNQMALLRQAGFSRVEHRFRKGNTSVILAVK